MTTSSTTQNGDAYPETDELIRRLEAAPNRDIAANHYRSAMTLVREQIDWPKANAAILDRWSMAGLKYIKERAWR